MAVKRGKAQRSGKLTDNGEGLRELSPKEQSALLAFDDEYAGPIDHRVADTLQEARELEALTKKYGTRLYANTNLTAKVAALLAPRRLILKHAEEAWSLEAHPQLSPAAYKKAFLAATVLKRQAIADLRYFLKDDAIVQATLSELQQGHALADLVSALDTLALLFKRHARALKKAKTLKSRHRLAELATLLGAGAATTKVERNDEAVALAQGLRNRAFWSLREAMDEVRAAGRYEFADQPKIRGLFSSSATHSHHAHPKGPPVSQAMAAAQAKVA